MVDNEASAKNFLKLGDEKYREQNYIGAVNYFEQYLALKPNDPLILNMVGFLYKKISPFESLDTQIEYFKKAIEIDSSYEVAIRNLAFAYQDAKMFEDSLELFLKLLDLNPTPDDYTAFGCLLLQCKNFEHGFKAYEWRFHKNFGATEYPKIDKPRWEGQEISDKILLVQYEQGFGDTIQFCRYVDKIKPLAAKIIFRVQDSLKELLQNSFKDIEIVSQSVPIEDLEFDYHIPLISILPLINASVDDIPMQSGYLKADKNKALEYKNKFFNNDALKIGICWHGASYGNKSRNIDLKYFYPLTKIKNVKLYSFQKDSGAQELENLPDGLEIIDLGKTFNNFSDTAAAIENIDIFVTSDNSVFNLSAAMGKKTYLLLNKCAEWRWFEDEEKTPWYKSVKIYKKSDFKQDWSELFEKIIQDIEKR